MISEETQKYLDRVGLEFELAELITEFVEVAKPSQLIKLAETIMKDCDCKSFQRMDKICEQLRALI